MNTWKIRIEKHRATWHYFTTNPQGGGFGSNYCGPKHIAMAKALRGVPDGDQYLVNGAGPFTRRTLAALTQQQPPYPHHSLGWSNE